MKRFIDLFKSKKQEKLPSENSYQVLCDAFGVMLEYARKSRQWSYIIDNDIWYS